jgi:hypothetical protein
MFRVPSDPREPSFDVTQKVGFFRWLTSTKTDRIEWRRRRDAAAGLAAIHQSMRGNDKAWAVLRARAERRVLHEVAQGRRTQTDAETFMRNLDEGRPPQGRVA